MPFVQAKCPECGGMLAVDDSKKAAMCQFCGEAFIVQEAVNNYITNNITNNTTNHNYGEGVVVNLYEEKSNDFIIEAGVLKEYHGASVDVVIPDGVKEISDYCFKGLKIETVVFPDSVTVIGYQAFGSCKNLSSITISNNLKTIFLGAFDDCDNLVSIINSGTGENIDKLAFFDKYKGFVFGEGSVLNEYKGSSVNVVIPDGVIKIADECFKNSNIVSIKIPDSVTCIGKNAFQDCKNLDSVYINDLAAWCRIEFMTGMSNPLNIAKCLYLNDELVTDLVIPNDVTNIGDAAFFGCKFITSVKIPYSVKNIGKRAFDKCSNITAINVESECSDYTSINGVLFDKEKTKLIKYPAGKNDSSYIIPGSVTSIGDFAFADCEKMTSIIISDSVTSIGDFAFVGCEKMTSIIIPDGVTSIGNDAFYDCTNLVSVYIPDSVTDIGFSVFMGCDNLREVNISESLLNKFKWCFDSGLYEQIMERKKEIEKQVKMQAEEIEKQRTINERKSKGLCQHCGGTFKGLFSSKCSICGKSKDY